MKAGLKGRERAGWSRSRGLSTRGRGTYGEGKLVVTHHMPWNDERNKSLRYPASGWNEGNLIPFEKSYRRSRWNDNAGIAFCFTEDGPFVGFDLDDVRRDSEFSDEALALGEQLDSYTEVSSSGDGLHVIAKGERIDDRDHRADLSEQGHIEVYEKNRYFVLTADVYEGYSTVEKRPTTVRAVQEATCPRTRRGRSSASRRL